MRYAEKNFLSGKSVKRIARFALLLGLVVILGFSVSPSAEAFAVRYYVTQNGGGTKSGASWGNALGEAEFITALQNASGGDEFWVAAGAYRPSLTANRCVSFVLKNGVALYGGFDGTETALAARDWRNNVTVLTGDLEGDDDVTNVNGITESFLNIAGSNSETVVTGSGTDATAVLDGFTVCGGDGGTDDSGAGMLNDGGSPTVANCTFCGNAAGYGGGMYNDGGSPGITDCTFSGNSASYGGGMVNISGSSPVIRGCTFSGNAANHYGAGMYNGNGTTHLINCTFYGNTTSYGGALWNCGSPAITNCTFSANVADTFGAAIYEVHLGNPSIKNCIFWDTLEIGQVEIYPSDPEAMYCVVQGGYAGTGNLDADPCLGSLEDNGGPTLTCALGSGSSALDSGTAAGAPGEDQRGIARPQPTGGNVDMGSLEMEQGTLRVTLEPEEARNAGARWSVDGGGTWRESGNVLTLLVGSYTVTFKNLLGYLAPGDQNISVGANAETTVTGTYDSIVPTGTAAGGGGGCVAGFFPQVFLLALPLVFCFRRK